MQFLNKVVVITGGTGILCSAMAKEFQKLGAKVIVLSLNATDYISDFKGIECMDCNVLDEIDLQKVNDQIKLKYHKIDILINGAGGNAPGATTEDEIYNKDLKNFFALNNQDFENVFSLNFMGTFNVVKCFLKLMIESGGVVLNISSMSAYAPMTKVPAYSAAKAAINNFTSWLAVYFAQSNIRVNAIAPGFFETKQNEKLLRNEDGTLTSRSKKILSQTPMKRFGVPSDLIGSVMFLCDETQSGFITGVVLPIDGGFLAYSGV